MYLHMCACMLLLMCVYVSAICWCVFLTGWLCVHFGPPPSALPLQQAQTSMAGQWQLTLNVYSAEKTPIVKRQNEEAIPKERRALLWFNTQPHEKVFLYLFIFSFFFCHICSCFTRPLFFAQFPSIDMPWSCNIAVSRRRSCHVSSHSTPIEPNRMPMLWCGSKRRRAKSGTKKIPTSKLFRVTFTSLISFFFLCFWSFLHMSLSWW